jgi:hypothetical protein
VGEGYDNGTGWGSFFRKLQKTDFTPGLGPHIQEECGRGFGDRAALPTMMMEDLPPQNRVLEAASRFFTEVNSVAYVLNYERFLGAIDKLYSAKASNSISTTAIILAVVSLVEKSDNMFRVACRYLEPTLAENQYESIQAIMLFVSGILCAFPPEVTHEVKVLCRLQREERNSAWVLLGCAIRMAKSLGLHKLELRHTTIGDHEAELQWRLWHSLCHMDTDLATTLGRLPECYEPTLEVTLEPAIKVCYKDRVLALC